MISFKLSGGHRARANAASRSAGRQVNPSARECQLLPLPHLAELRDPGKTRRRLRYAFFASLLSR